MSVTDFYEILKFLLPQLVLLALVVIFLEHWLRKERILGMTKRKDDVNRLILPNQIHAFERMVLFLERIAPINLIPRLNQQDLTANEFQFILTKEIADEYEHNLSQQLYIPNNTWNFITLTKDQIMQEVIQAAQSLPSGATSKDLAYKIIENLASNKKLSTQEAIQMVKKDLFSIIG